MQVAVVEAGLGGRHDATATVRAPIVVLTNVGLEHTRWLGPTVADIAREKLAVVGPEATLVLGEVDSEVEALADATGARIVRPEPADSVLPGFQRANFAVACAAAREQLGRSTPRSWTVWPRASSCPGACRSSASGRCASSTARTTRAASRRSPRPSRSGRSSRSSRSSTTRTPARCCSALRARCDAFVCTAAPTPRALPPATLASLAEQLGATAEIVPEPRAAVARAEALAGPGGAVIVTGSIYLVADLVSAPGTRRASAL